jgi:hypothetical protein
VVERSAVKIELLYFDGCPHHERLLEQLPALLDRAGITGRPILRTITEQDGEREQFLGSPTLRINGRDVEPNRALVTGLTTASNAASTAPPRA